MNEKNCYRLSGTGLLVIYCHIQHPASTFLKCKSSSLLSNSKAKTSLSFSCRSNCSLQAITCNFTALNCPHRMDSAGIAIDTFSVDDFVMIEQEDSLEAAAEKDHLDAISGNIEDLSDELRHISLSIHDKPELQFKEYHAHRVLTEYLKKQDGWNVTPSAYDIETAFVAVYDSGKKGPVVSFNAEYGAM